MFIKPIHFLLSFIFICTVSVSAQKKIAAKYPSLLWEITGNGLSKPSYLFGTMHVSSKMVFHLGDSFYLALKSVDAVALELNPDTWQGEMVAMNNIKQQYTDFVRTPRGDYLTENSFRISAYDDALKAALSSETNMTNSLLYRSYKEKEDFEEDTFLDLYIYQTGKKLGKRATAVENYFDTEKMVMEAYAARAKEKKRRNTDTEVESQNDIFEKTQDAYRRGDLDLLDSLDRIMDRSDAFTEKFLFERNIIQANSMDTIMKKSSLFAGIGASHLPGPRGVIELLRKMGYTLRPVAMNDRDAAQKELIDTIKVPVNFSTITAEDGSFSVAMPGPLYNIDEEKQVLYQRQYADMANGSYYLVTRVKTHAPFLGHSEKDVLNKVDSMLYENIPGKILSKKQISNNGYAGFDITNRTRRGDLQRYHIFIKPFEVLFFKMSGKANYADGPEAEQFFSSIQLKQAVNRPVCFEPRHGEFSVKLPQQPVEFVNTVKSDMTERWAYEAADNANGDAYLIFKKALYNFQFLDEDLFELGLMEESFRNPDYFEKQISREQKTHMGYPALEVKERMKDGSIVTARFIIRGAHYYVIAAKSNNKKADFSTFFNSFKFKPFAYNPATAYIDTFMHFTVNTPVAPDINNAIRAIIEDAAENTGNGNNVSGSFSYWPKIKNGVFSSMATGEMIGLSIQEFPEYYYVKDSATFLFEEMKDFYRSSTMFLYKTDTVHFKNNVQGLRLSLRDTGSSRSISRMLLHKDNYTYSLVTLGDTLSEESSFIESFYKTAAPSGKTGKNIYESRLHDFFTDLFSKDSSAKKKAQQSLAHIYFDQKAVPQVKAAIDRLNLTDKEYFDIKVKLIAELGYIRDTADPLVVDLLKKIYESTADTGIFQNEVFKALATHKTKKAYALFKALILQDPPFFPQNYQYNSLFLNLGDSLLLARELFPELLQLLTLDDYKEQVLGLLVTLVDSNLVKAADYESYFNKIYFDARIELKKLQLKDEKILEKELTKAADENKSNYTIFNRFKRRNELEDYCVLLIPFYNTQKNVPRFFERLLRSREPEARMAAAVLMLRSNLYVADSILLNLAADDKYRSRLYVKLANAKRLDHFPARYKNQIDISRSLLLADKDYNQVDSVVFIKKQPAAYLDKKGVVYFFKYRVNKEDDWKIGVSGLQPGDEKKISTGDRLTRMTEKKLKPNDDLDAQLQEQLKRILFGVHPSAKHFYTFNKFADYRPVAVYED